MSMNVEVKGEEGNEKLGCEERGRVDVGMSRKKVMVFLDIDGVVNVRQAHPDTVTVYFFFSLPLP